MKRIITMNSFSLSLTLELLFHFLLSLPASHTFHILALSWRLCFTENLEDVKRLSAPCTCACINFHVLSCHPWVACPLVQPKAVCPSVHPLSANQGQSSREPPLLSLMNHPISIRHTIISPIKTNKQTQKSPPFSGHLLLCLSPCFSPSLCRKTPYMLTLYTVFNFPPFIPFGSHFN